MPIKDIVAKILGLEKVQAELQQNQATATAASVLSLKTEIEAVKATALAELTQAQSDLTTAKQTISSLETAKTAAEAEKTGIVGALVAACIAVKAEGGDESKIKALTPAEQITALQTNASTTIAKLQVDQSKIPAAKPAATQTSDATTKSRADFFKMSPAAQLAFTKSGGKIND